MKLNLYNTLTRKIELFVPIDSQRVTMYVCGPTVYNRVHIGNARPAIIFDVLFRVLRELYPNVVYARNITDIDDKIIKAAAEHNEEIGLFSKRFADAYFEDMAEINNLEPTIVPYATEHISEMQAMVKQLIEKGHAYESEGHVLFAVQSMPDYGKLSNRSLEDMLAGARVEVADYKKYAGDFVLWKPSTSDEPGWESPWGRGRPGWHLECSAMIEKHLGDTIDIHGGGQDLIFPHHENEIAQSCCAHDGKKFVNYWLHNGYINFDGEKMSKSLGNFRLVRDLLSQYPGEVLRYAILSAHYRSESNFSSELLDQAWRSLDTLYGHLRKVKDIESGDTLALAAQPFFTALLDDMKTPVALSELHSLGKKMNSADVQQKADLKGLMLKAGQFLGLLNSDPDQWFKDERRGEASLTDDQINALISDRENAKKDRDFTKADQIRANLTEHGIVLEDSREGTTWRRK